MTNGDRQSSVSDIAHGVLLWVCWHVARPGLLTLFISGLVSTGNDLAQIFRNFLSTAFYLSADWLIVTDAYE